MIVSNNILESNSFDIIGHIFEYGRMDTSKKDKSKHKMLLHLQYIEYSPLLQTNINTIYFKLSLIFVYCFRDTKLNVTLWGQNTYYMCDFLANNNNLAPVVVIVQFITVKFINGRPFSSTYFDVSRLFISNDIDGITSYKDNGIKMIASKQDTEHNDFLKNHLFYNIDDVFEHLEEKTVIIVGTVKGIRQNIRWYYLACSNCKKSARQKSLLPIRLIVLMKWLKSLLMNVLILYAKISKFWLFQAFCFDLMMQHANSDSFMIGSSDIGSHETKVLKTAGNLTPCARDNSTATSQEKATKLISTPTELKTNLATCIDLHEMENLSTSKSAQLSPPDEQPMPLLVPKKER
uniref:Replication factor A C-terminal domain-containing protein n=1 Tax=Lactuca sativa TaxID=4236 RepID=A0A9R1USH0_LACSA|nr:hypothetical protein LSAT_V11C800389200 [Lactuca sativa]